MRIKPLNSQTPTTSSPSGIALRGHAAAILTPPVEWASAAIFSRLFFRNIAILSAADINAPRMGIPKRTLVRSMNRM